MGVQEIISFKLRLSSSVQFWSPKAKMEHLVAFYSAPGMNLK